MSKISPKAEPKTGTNCLYVIITQLPKEQQKEFEKWIVGQTCHTIEKEGENMYNCAYYRDYSRWYDSWANGKRAEIYD